MQAPRDPFTFNPFAPRFLNGIDDIGTPAGYLDSYAELGYVGKFGGDEVRTDTIKFHCNFEVYALKFNVGPTATSAAVRFRDWDGNYMSNTRIHVEAIAGYAEFPKPLLHPWYVPMGKGMQVEIENTTAFGADVHITFIGIRRDGPAVTNPPARIPGLLTCFDFLPFVRPEPELWPALMRGCYDSLLRAGGRVNRWYATDLINLTGVNAPLARKATADYYLPVTPGSFVWAVSFFAGQGQVDDNGQQACEVQIIDTCTKEDWWRTSQDAGALGGNLAFNDENVAKVTAVFNARDRLGVGFAPMWMLPAPRAIGGTGVQMVRITSNPAVGGSALESQVVLHVSEPEPVRAGD